MGFPKGAGIPFGRERGSNPARDFNLIFLGVLALRSLGMLESLELAAYLLWRRNFLS